MLPTCYRPSSATLTSIDASSDGVVESRTSYFHAGAQRQHPSIGADAENPRDACPDSASSRVLAPHPFRYGAYRGYRLRADSRVPSSANRRDFQCLPSQPPRPKTVTCRLYMTAQLHRQMGGSFGTQVYSKFGRSRLKERRREEVISRNNRVLDEVSQARIVVVSYVERRSG